MEEGEASSLKLMRNGALSWDLWLVAPFLAASRGNCYKEHLGRGTRPQAHKDPNTSSLALVLAP